MHHGLCDHGSQCTGLKWPCPVSKNSQDSLRNFWSDRMVNDLSEPSMSQWIGFVLFQVSEPDEFGYAKDRRKVFVYFFGTKQM